MDTLPIQAYSTKERSSHRHATAFFQAGCALRRTARNQAADSISGTFCAFYRELIKDYSQNDRMGSVELLLILRFTGKIT